MHTEDATCVDAFIDAIRFCGMAVRSLMITTGTPMDFVRELLNAIIIGSQKSCDSRGVNRMWGAYDEVGRWIEGMRRGKSVGLSLEPRDRPPIAFHIVAWTHYMILAFCIAYPLLFCKDDGWDAAYMSFIVFVIAHWFVFYGECMFLYFEKRLFYKTYEMGSMPNLFWFGDMLPWQISLAIILMSVLGINSSIATVFLRNVSFHLVVDSSSVTAAFRLK